MSNICKIKNDSIVTWTIFKKNIVKSLIGNLTNDKFTGLLYSDTESAGDIDFIDHSCKPDKTCNKKTIKDIKYENGSSDSVVTPNAIINFHTHPLSCYVEAKTIWGWPSGEDLARSIEFAFNGNLCHIVFAVEGTYIMEVNKYFIEYFKMKRKTIPIILKNIIDNIEKIFQLTHKHRMYINESEPSLSLKDEFNGFFLQNFGLQQAEYIVHDWLKLVNNLNILSLIKLGELAKNKIQSKEFIIKPIDLKDIPDNILNMKIFNISFFKNDTPQWDKKYKSQDEMLFKYLSSNKYRLKIQLPSKIEYSAPFVSAECKL